MLDVLIIGGGPTGSYLADKLAQAGFATLVLEEHPTIGEPVHCTGVVGEKVLREFDIPEAFVEGEIQSFLSSGRKIFPPA